MYGFKRWWREEAGLSIYTKMEMQWRFEKKLASLVNSHYWFLYDSKSFQKTWKLRILGHLKNIRHEAKVILMET